MKQQTRALVRLLGTVLVASAAITAADLAIATQAPAAAPAPVERAKKKAPLPPAKLVDINKASAAELKTLPGIGDEEARKIVAGRPYLSKADLVTEKILPQGTYISLKRRIVATQPGKLPPKRK